MYTIQIKVDRTTLYPDWSQLPIWISIGTECGFLLTISAPLMLSRNIRSPSGNYPLRSKRVSRESRTQELRGLELYSYSFQPQGEGMYPLCKISCDSLVKNGGKVERRSFWIRNQGLNRLETTFSCVFAPKVICKSAKLRRNRRNFAFSRVWKGIFVSTLDLKCIPLFFSNVFLQIQPMEKEAHPRFVTCLVQPGIKRWIM